MRLLVVRLFVIFLFLTFPKFINSQPAVSLKNSSYTYLKSNLEFLASNELEGREAASRGEKIAALFISEELEKYGVLPYGDNGTYFQDFNMVIRKFTGESSVALKSKDNVRSFLNGTDIAYSKRIYPDTNFSQKEYEIVFAGYGIISEEDNYDSYKKIDVANKVVAVINGTPKLEGKEILGDNALRKFGWRSSAKIDIAVEKGAVGLIILPDDMILRNWGFFSRWTTIPSFNLEEEVLNNLGEPNIPVLIFNEAASLELFNNEKTDYESIQNSNPTNPDPFNLNKKIVMDYEVDKQVRISRNIIGLVKGNDESLSHEYVTLGAHYDHEGIRNGEIYYGADDNGSGTVTIMEVARRLAEVKNNKRPVLIIFHTAEEKGLKGSKYLTQNAGFMDSIIVHLNFDMVGRKSEDSIYCIGASKISNELGELIEEVNARTSNIVLDYKFDDPTDPLRLYYRSDHYNYAKLGIPIAFFYDNMKVDYTKPTDTVDKINFNKLLRITDLAYNVIVELSNLKGELERNKK